MTLTSVFAGCRRYNLVGPPWRNKGASFRVKVKNNVDKNTHFSMGIISCGTVHDILNQAQTTFWETAVLDYVFFKQSGVNCSKLINIIGIMNPSSKRNHIRNCNQSWSQVADVWERSVCTAHWTDSRNMKGSVCYNAIQYRSACSQSYHLHTQSLHVVLSSRNLSD